MVHSISENKDGNTDDLVIKTLISDVNINMKMEHIDQMHWIGSFKKDSGNRKSKSMIGKFRRYANICNIRNIFVKRGKGSVWV